MNEFLNTANPNDWTPDPHFRGMVWKRKTPYIDFNYRGKRVRYNLVEGLLERCRRLKKPVTKDAVGKLVIPPDEWDLYLRVIERLVDLEFRTTPETVTASEVSQ